MSDDSRVNVSPSTSSCDLHQESTSNVDLKHPFAPSEHGSNADEPKKKKKKTLRIEIPGTSKLSLANYSQEAGCSGMAASNTESADGFLLGPMNEKNYSPCESPSIIDSWVWDLYYSKNVDGSPCSSLSPKMAEIATADQASNSDNETSMNLDASPSAVDGQQYTCAEPSAVCQKYKDEQCKEKNEDQQPSEDFSAFLPLLIKEKIFMQLPFRHLMTARLVSTHWKEVIDNSKFLMWKKAYYEVRARRYSSPCWLSAWSYLDKQDVLGVNCFDSLIRFMAYNFQRNWSPDLEPLLHEMPSYDSAKILLSQKYQDLPSVYENLWCILTVIILLSVSVEDLYKALEPLVTHYKGESAILSEALFCIATSLLYFVKRSKISRGIHYRLYSVLYLLENQTSTQYFYQPLRKIQESSNESGLRKSMSYEQIEIMKHKLGPKQVIKIRSFAGTGKTSILSQFARKHSNLKILYLTTSEVLCEAAKSKFPFNVHCKTPYSLALSFGTIYDHKLRGKVNPTDILPFLHHWESLRQYSRAYTESIALTIENFCQSTDQQLTLNHALYTEPLLKHSLQLYNQPDASSFNKTELLCSIILNEAVELWEKLISLTNNRCKVWPSVYVKLFQLSQPSLSKYYDCVIVDQAEDFYPMTLDLVLSKGIPVFLAGDYNQQIDLLQNPKNAWSDVAATHTYYLKQSFRFGPEIAYVADCFTEAAMHSNECNIIGSFKKSCVTGTIDGQCAIISCTYECLIDEAIRLCCTDDRYEYEPAEFRGAFVGGISRYDIDQMIDMCMLKFERYSCDLSDEVVKRFCNYLSLEMYAEESDESLASKVRIVNKYGTACLYYLKTIKKKCSHDLATADIVFSTVHNAKGFEFDTVIVLNDFYLDNLLESKIRSGKTAYTSKGVALDTAADRKGMNYSHSALYTAVTRAKKSLIMCEALWSILMQKQENFYYPVKSTELMQRGDAICSQCRADITFSSLFTMVTPAMTLSNGSEILNGPLCNECSQGCWYCTSTTSL